MPGGLLLREQSGTTTQQCHINTRVALLTSKMRISYTSRQYAPKPSKLQSTPKQLLPVHLNASEVPAFFLFTSSAQKSQT